MVRLQDRVCAIVPNRGALQSDDKATNPFMLFFFSYARADFSPFLQKFYDDLREAVRSKAGEADADKIAFRDAKSIEPGQPWPEEITRALRVCKVFVYLHTPTYFTRNGCGKEFRIISDRLATANWRGATLSQASCLQPVFWDGPKQPINVPPEIVATQLTHEDYGADYNLRGMLPITRASYGKEYWDALDAMALRIATAAQQSPLPEFRDVLDWEKIEPLFPVSTPAAQSVAFTSNKPTRAPRYARFVWIVGKREEQTAKRSLECYDPDGIAEEWLPFLPDNKPARLIAAEAVHEVKLTYASEQDVPQTQQDLENLIDKTAKEHTPIVIVTDIWSLHLDRYKALVSIFEEGKKDNCAVIFPWNLNDQETMRDRDRLRQTLADVFPVQFNKAEPSLLFEGIADLDTFKTELSKLLTKYVADIDRSLKAVRQLPEAPAFKEPPQLGPTSAST